MPTDDRAFPSRPIVGVGAVVLSERGVVLIRRGKAPNIGNWSLPGGAQEVGETVNEAAIREVEEETGLTADVLGIVDVVDSISRNAQGRVEYHYTLVDVVAVAPPDAVPVAGGDAADAAWVPIEDLPTYELWSETIRVIGKAHEMWQVTNQRSRNDVDTEL